MINERVGLKKYQIKGNQLTFRNEDIPAHE
jgi:hypothetical protein